MRADAMEVEGPEPGPSTSVFCDHLQHWIPEDAAVPVGNLFIHVDYLEAWADENRTHLGLPYRTEDSPGFEFIAVFDGLDYSQSDIEGLRRKGDEDFYTWLTSKKPIEPVLTYRIRVDDFLQSALNAWAGLNFFLLKRGDDVIKVLMP